MAKSPKSNSDLAAAGDTTGRPLRGIEQAAWWSVPGVGVIALACVATLGYLYLNKPQTAAFEKPVATKPVEKVEETKQPKEFAATPKPQPKETPVGIVEPVVAAEPTQAEAPTATENQPNPKPAVAASAQGPVSVNAIKKMSLVCVEDKIEFEGQQELKFVDKQPSLEIMEQGGAKFAHLVFNGTDQSIELPPIQKDTGSLEMVAKLPDRKTSIFLDSNFQRLTLRKNRDGLRWRVAAEQKPAKIRYSPKQVDFNQWHHIVVTWKDGADAVLYVDGVEHDRYVYVDEQPHYANYQKVVLGRTRGPNGRYYECNIHKFNVYDQQLPAEEVLILNNSLRQSYSFIFQ